MSAGFAPPTVTWRGATDPGAPLVAPLDSREPNESDIVALAERISAGPAYAAVRAPVAEDGGQARFADRGIGRFVAESLAATMAWCRARRARGWEVLLRQVRRDGQTRADLSCWELALVATDTVAT